MNATKLLRLSATTLILLLSGCEQQPEIGVGLAAPVYGAVDLAGDSVHLANLRDSVVLLNVWATWCIPCREEIPALQALHERNASRGLAVVGVSVDGSSDRSKIQPFADAFHVTYRIWHDPNDAARTRFRIIGVPANFLIDRRGILVWRQLGPIDVDDPALNEALEAALATPKT